MLVHLCALLLERNESSRKKEKSCRKYLSENGAAFGVQFGAGEFVIGLRISEGRKNILEKRKKFMPNCGDRDLISQSNFRTDPGPCADSLTV